MWGAIGAIFSQLLGWFLNRNKANLAEVADSNARAQERLGQEETANEVQTKAGRARRNATSDVVRVIADGKSPTDTAEQLKLKFPKDFRD